MLRPPPLSLSEVHPPELSRIRQGIDPAQPLGRGLLRSAAPEGLPSSHRRARLGLQMATDYLEMLADPLDLQRGDLRSGPAQGSEPAGEPPGQYPTGQESGQKGKIALSGRSAPKTTLYKPL